MASTVVGKSGCVYNQGKALHCHCENHHFSVFKAESGNESFVVKRVSRPFYDSYAIGNAMWRSPEGQTGRGVTKASGIFSSGLVCMFAFGGRDNLILHNYRELVSHGIASEQEILTRHFFCFFGPVPQGLLKQVNDEDWCTVLRRSTEVADMAVRDQPELRFEHWGKELDPQAQDMISGMTNLDPSARTTIDQVLAHRWWQEAS